MKMQIARFPAAATFVPGFISILCIRSIRGAAGERKEVELCHTEIYRSFCEKDEVILVHSAHYGRIVIGRCVTENFGYLGCMHDVMPEMTSLCSGRHGCEVRIDDNTFTRATPCHRDLKSHLWIDYDCVKVIVPDRPCQSTEETLLITSSMSSTSPLFLSSQVAQDTGCGTTDTPWVIEASPGQRINFTLYDFSSEAALPKEEEEELNPGPDSPLCRVYATLRDRSASSRGVTICEGVAAKVNVFTSSTHKVEVRLLPMEKVKDSSNFKERIQAQFLIQFKAIGCAMPTLGDGVKMLSRTTDALYLGCATRQSSSSSSSASTWQMRCVDNQWIGTHDNCSRGSSPATRWSGIRFPSDTFISYGHSILVTALIALVVICIILVSGILCIKWRHSIDRRNGFPISEISNKFSRHYEFSSSGIYSPDYRDFQKTPTHIAAEGTSSTLRVNEYATWRMVTAHSPGTMSPTGRVYESLDVAPLASASSRTDRCDTLRVATHGRMCTPYLPCETLAWDPVQNQSFSSCKHTL